ncbi:MAG: type IV pilus assembly protein PilX [Enterobacterales bacterium]|jgi:type IV pilus assembly protein PilX
MNLKHQQQGVALVIGLILLVVMTLLGVSATSTALMEEKMAGNMRDLELALHAGETGLRDAELWINSLTNEPNPDNTGTTGVWNLDAMDPTATNNTNWWEEVNTAWWGTTNAIDYTTVTLAGIGEDPRSVIEELGFVKDSAVIGVGGLSTEGTTFYRVTTKGTGGSEMARVLLQSTWGRRY